MRRGFNILLLVPPSSQLLVFSLHVINMVRRSPLEHGGIYREIPVEEFADHKITNVGSFNTGKQIKNNIAANKTLYFRIQFSCQAARWGKKTKQ